MAANFQDLSKQLCQFYYQTFDTDRKQLAPLYRANSMLTYESESFQGVESIVNKLANLPFQKLKHEVATMDPMPGVGGQDGALVLVTGAIAFDDAEHPMKFAQTFHISKDEQGYYVSHDIFKLIF